MATKRSALGANPFTAAAIGRDAVIPAAPPEPASRPPAPPAPPTMTRVALYLSVETAEYLRDVVSATGRTYTMGSLVDEALAAYLPVLERELNDGEKFTARPPGTKLVTGPAVRPRSTTREG